MKVRLINKETVRNRLSIRDAIPVVEQAFLDYAQNLSEMPPQSVLGPERIPRRLSGHASLFQNGQYSGP